MCGRFTLNQSSAAIANLFCVENIPDLAAQYNIAPTQRVATVLLKRQRGRVQGR